MTLFAAASLTVSSAALLASAWLLWILVRDAIHRRKEEGFLAFVGEPSSVQLALRPPMETTTDDEEEGSRYFSEVRPEAFMKALAARTPKETVRRDRDRAVLEPHLVPRDVVSGAKADLRRIITEIGYRLKAFEVIRTTLAPGRTLLRHVQHEAPTDVFVLDVHACAHRKGKADAHCFRTTMWYYRSRGGSILTHTEYLGTMPEFLAEKN